MILSNTIQSVFLSATPMNSSAPAMQIVDDSFRLTLIISILILLVIVGILVALVIRSDRRAGVTPIKSAKSSWLLQTIVTGVLVILMVILCATGLKGYAKLVTSPQHAYDVYVTAQDSSWIFEHRNGKIQDDGQLYIPANQPVRLTLTSRDMTYSLSLPAFRIKQDVLPARETSLWFEASPGQYQLNNVEYSGENCIGMNAIVTAYEGEAFVEALDSVAYWLDAYTNDELYKAGLRLFTGNCLECHSLDGSSKIGPSFRETFSLWGKARPLEGGGEIIVDEEYIRRSLLSPQVEVVKGYKDQEMTNFTGQLRDREIVALIDFIRRLDEVVDEEGNPLEEIAQTQE